MSKLNPIKEIMRYQTDRNMHKQEYDALNEHTNIFEEMMESIGGDIKKENRPKLKTLLQDFSVKLALDGIVQTYIMSKDKIVDAYADIIVFCIGAIMKLGYDPEKILVEVSKEINSRKGEIIDGKFEKDLSPEAKANWYEADFRECVL